MSFESLLADLEHLGIRPVLRDSGVKLAGPRSRLIPELLEKARIHKAALLAHVRAIQAQDLVNRLKGYTVPAGKMPAARALALRVRGLTDQAEILSALQKLERELTAFGGKYDRELAKAVAMVEQAFPGARLVG